MEDAGEHTVEYAEDGATDPALIGAKIGRYQLLELVGSGGMGMVWGAWDPELERRVALKLVRIVAEGARERMLREGQVLARLSHPNVVPIYDVGVMGAQVYLVMEWVRGETLRQFADSKPTERDLVDAYRQAGAGLAAAHEAGVVHRDFKPANAIRGEDGRVRVLDFGIAANEASSEAPAAGTPRYMAPEQRAGEVATAASDQYAFGISLLEAFGPDATPGWIATIIERGTDPDPARRFPSMQALVDALARDPARRRRRALAGVVLVVAALGAFAIGRSRTRDAAAVEPCSGAATELATSWSPALRDRAASHLRTLGPAAEGDKLAAELDGYGREWIAVYDRACKAHERKELTPALYETRLSCLARTRSQLAAVGEVMSSVSAEELPQAILAARSLPDVAGCADITGAIVPPPVAVADRVTSIVPQVERALVLATAKRADAAGLAHEATEQARSTGYEPLIARALLVEGRAKIVNMSQNARDMFADAMRRALRVSDDALAVEAYARWIFENARWGETTIDHWDVMVEVAGRLGREGRFGAALMYNNRANAYLFAGDTENARKLFEHALVAAGDLDDLELLVIRVNLVRLERDPVAYEAALHKIYDRLAPALGPEHPDLIVHRVSLALLEPDRQRARTMMLEARSAYERWQDYDAARLYTFEAAMIALDGGDREAVAALMADVVDRSRALAMRDTVMEWFTGTPSWGSDLRTEIADAYVAIAHDAPDRRVTVAALERALDVYAQSQRPWERLAAADACIVLGSWARADELFRTVEQPFYARKRAQIQRGLAGSLATTDVARAQVLARDARTFYARDPGAAAAVAELDAILTTESH